MTALAVRSLATMSEADLRESAMGRVNAAAAKYGADSPQVRAALARWGRYLDTQPAVDDLTALVDAVVSPHLLANAQAERAWREQVAR